MSSRRHSAITTAASTAVSWPRGAARPGLSGRHRGSVMCGNHVRVGETRRPGAFVDDGHLEQSVVNEAEHDLADRIAIGHRRTGHVAWLPRHFLQQGRPTVECLQIALRGQRDGGHSRTELPKSNSR